MEDDYGQIFFRFLRNCSFFFLEFRGGRGEIMTQSWKKTIIQKFISEKSEFRYQNINFNSENKAGKQFSDIGKMQDYEDKSKKEKNCVTVGGRVRVHWCLSSSTTDSVNGKVGLQHMQTEAHAVLWLMKSNIPHFHQKLMIGSDGCCCRYIKLWMLTG